MIMRLYLFLFLVLLLAGCHREETPKAPTAEQNAQLDDADAMLDNLAANEDTAPANAAP